MRTERPSVVEILARIQPAIGGFLAVWCLMLGVGSLWIPAAYRCAASGNTPLSAVPGVLLLLLTIHHIRQPRRGTMPQPLAWWLFWSVILWGGWVMVNSVATFC